MLALVVIIPVLCFCAIMVILDGRFGHPLFFIGAELSFLAGCFKATRMLVLAIA